MGIIVAILKSYQIKELIEEPKRIKENIFDLKLLRERKNSKHRNVSVKGSLQHNFRIILRQSRIDPLDFTAGLIYIRRENNQDFILLRYNGSHSHKNVIEKEVFEGFHIHTATERYQEYGSGRVEGYAQQTDRYSTLTEAIECLIKDSNITIIDSKEEPLLF